MQSQDSHLTDQELLLAADGELLPDRAAEAAAHLSACWSCRARKQEMEHAVADFVRFHHGNLDPLLPSAAGPRALLKARMEKAASVRQPWWKTFAWGQAAVALIFAATVLFAYHSWVPFSGPRAAFRSVPVFFPEPSLTPGVAETVSREQVCRSARPKNRAVPVSLQRRVFEEYGIPTAEPRAYEVDYLITPALGGADDIRNLWPQSASSAVWNARVKDALEDRLYELVCDGNLDLAAAQHDISSDWIAAYKKYFHTDKPLETAPEN
jgi:hypothetical protein